MRPSALATIALGIAALAAPAAHAADPWYTQAGATWSQAYFTEPDGTTLHADVLRPKGLPGNARTPVILSIGPYFGHAAQEGVVDGAYDPVGANGAQPQPRFQDFIQGAHLMQRGYTWVQVDLRGFGGSTGCLDWAGPGEQTDVKSAVEWAASQPWSTGAVGMSGQSYDGVTGLIGVSVQPKGLKSIVSQEPVYDLYRYLYTNGVRYENSLATPALYDGIADTPGQATDSPTYIGNSVNDTASPGCSATNYANQAGNNDHSSAYWKARDLIAESKGHKVPIFMTQGFLENNTKPDGAWDYFNELKGPKQAWFGMWDHIRGNDVAEGDNAAPSPWFDEVMRFYDRYLKGIKPTVKDPAIAVETSDGSWRAETRWPPVDAIGYTSKLRPGSYTDQPTAGSAEGDNPDDSLGTGAWTISPPLKYDAHLAGVPSVTLDVTSPVPDANLSTDLYDIDAKGNALLLSRNAYLLSQGEQRISPEMYGNDWLIPAGHRIGVLVTSADDEWWTPTQTLQSVTLNGGTVTLPFLRYARTVKLSGYKRPQRLDDWLKAAPFALDAATITGSTSSSFVLPPRQR